MEDVRFIWLFDDDNLPLPDAFEKLQFAYSYFGNDSNVALVSLRPGRAPYHQAALNGQNVDIRPGTFMDFKFSEWLMERTKHLAKRLHIWDSPSATATDWDFRTPLCRISIAPYGGLLFHKSWLAEIGLPMKELYLYSDDHLFSWQMQNKGGRLFLCSESRLEELEPSWPGRRSRIPVLMQPEFDECKIYCLVRNRVYLESQMAQPKWRYAASMFWFFVTVTAEALLFGAGLKTIIRRIRLVYAAIHAAHHDSFETDSAGRPILPSSIAGND